MDLQRSVLEPMGAAMAVVATSAVLKGLAVSAGLELLVADEPKDFALKVVHLLAKDALRAELGARAQSFVMEHYSWNHMATQFGQVVEGINQPPPSAATSGPVPEPLAKAQR
jgi:glycosyltransferase involved in cell wall biosynthesis